METSRTSCNVFPLVSIFLPLLSLKNGHGLWETWKDGKETELRLGGGGRGRQLVAEVYSRLSLTVQLPL